MSHLSRETLARLVDEPPTAAEAEHLENCAECRRELDELIALTAALGDLPDLLPPPPSAWPALAERLRREGLVRPVPRARRLPLPARRAAAAVLIFVAGGIAGFVARGGMDTPDRVARQGEAAPLPRIQPVNEIEEAALALSEAEERYRAALARYTELAGAVEGADPIARLMTLDDIVVATSRALQEAPADPVINGYHLTALAQREATVRQIVKASGGIWY